MPPSPRLPLTSRARKTNRYSTLSHIRYKTRKGAGAGRPGCLDSCTVACFHERFDLGGHVRKGEIRDLVVSCGKYFDEKRVSDEAIERFQSELTIVDGKVVYSAMD